MMNSAMYQKNRARRRLGIRTAALALVMAVMATTSVAHAQRYGPGDRWIELSGGERGQTVIVTGQTDGAINAGRETAVDGPCAGWVPLRPSHLLVLTDDFRRLSLSVESSADTTLVVHGPGGTRCNDDTNGVNPELSGEWVAGTYSVYVGAYYEGTHAEYNLTIRQGGGYEGGLPAATTLNVTSPTAQYASIAVSARVGREGVAVDGRSGGSVDISYLGNSPNGPCVGFAEATPNHIITIHERLPGAVIHVEAGGDTTLAIQGPTGWRCNDDGRTVDPEIAGGWEPGVYLVWVGSYEAGAVWDYRLSVYVDAPHAPPPQRPTSWSFRGAFEDSDLFLSGESVDQLNASCLSYLASTGGANWIDNVTLGSRTANNASSYWDEAQLCAMVALNAQPDNGVWESTVAGSVEGMPFEVHGDTDEIRRVLTTYIPRMASAGFIDDIEVNGARFHNGPSYWEPAQVATILAYNIEPSRPSVVARGTIEEIPFIFAGDSPQQVADECRAFFASGISDTMIDDVVVNGTPRHNGPGYWDAGQVCMMVASLAE